MGGVGNSLTEYVDSVEIGGQDNVLTPSGFVPAYFVAYAPKSNFELETNITIPALFLNTSIQLLANPSSTILSGSIGIIQKESVWYNNVLDTAFQVRCDHLLHSFGKVAYVGDECSYPYFTNFVGLRPSFTVPSFSRLYACLEGQTIAELAKIYPTTIMDIITNYGETLGFMNNGLVTSPGKLFMHTTAYNSTDLATLDPIT